MLPTISMKNKDNFAGGLGAVYASGSRDSHPVGVQGAKPHKNFECRALGGLKMSYPDSMFQEFDNNTEYLWLTDRYFWRERKGLRIFTLTKSGDFRKTTDDWKHCLCTAFLNYCRYCKHTELWGCGRGYTALLMQINMPRGWEGLHSTSHADKYA